MDMDIIIPELSESITEGTISSWMKKEGEVVKLGDLLLELETDKVNLEINAESDGILEKIIKRAGETVVVGEAVGSIGSAVDVQPERQTAEADKKVNDTNVNEVNNVNKVDKKSSEQNSSTEVYHASPSVRKLARERGVDLNQFDHEAPIGITRVTRADLDKHTTDPIVKSDQPEKPERTAVIAQEAMDLERPVKRQPMSRRRVTIAKRLVEAQRTAAMLTTFNEVDMTAILDIRKRRKQSFMEKHEVGLGFMSFFVKAVVGALKAFPMLNAEIDKEEIILKQYYDIGIAVSAKEGLVVPVVRGVDRMNFAEIERQIGELANKARENTLALADLQGGTFTITNGGVFGSLFSTPILNAPQVGILGMHTIQKRPVAIDDINIEVRPMMYIALSYDHRIVDGSEAVRFLVTVKQLLEDPESLLLEG